MIRLTVVDTTAQSRKRIADRISAFLAEGTLQSSLLPPIAIKALAPEELRFHAAPEVCVIGSEMIQQSIAKVREIKEQFSQSIILVETRLSDSNIALLDQMARLGADDAVALDDTPEAFLSKLVFLTRRMGETTGGDLIVVDSGKGGVGATSVTAALGEYLALLGKGVILVDGDSPTQDLTRFLQVRPFVNENLQLLLDGVRPATEEFVYQCTSQVFSEIDRLLCMPPPLETPWIADKGRAVGSILGGLLELLLQSVDNILVDVAGIQGPLTQVVYSKAKHVLLVTNNDPSALSGLLAKAALITTSLAPSATLRVITNGADRNGLPAAMLRDEFLRSSGLGCDVWIETPIPYCKQAVKWPGSGYTPYSHGRPKVGKAIAQIALQLELSDASSPTRSIRELFRKDKVENTIPTRSKQEETQLQLPFMNYLTNTKENSNGRISEQTI